MVNYYFDKGAAILEPYLIQELKKSNEKETRDFVKGMLNNIKPVNKVSLCNCCINLNQSITKNRQLC